MTEGFGRLRKALNPKPKTGVGFSVRSDLLVACARTSPGGVGAGGGGGLVRFRVYRVAGLSKP